MSGDDITTDPRVHRSCIEMQIAVQDGLEAAEQLAFVERTYAEQLAALGTIAKLAKGGESEADDR